VQQRGRGGTDAAAPPAARGCQLQYRATRAARGSTAREGVQLRTRAGAGCARRPQAASRSHVAACLTASAPQHAVMTGSLWRTLTEICDLPTASRRPIYSTVARSSYICRKPELPRRLCVFLSAAAALHAAACGAGRAGRCDGGELAPGTQQLGIGDIAMMRPVIQLLLVRLPVLVLVLVLVLMIISVQAQPSPGEAGFGPGFNGLATRPPMGYVRSVMTASCCCSVLYSGSWRRLRLLPKTSRICQMADVPTIPAGGVA
jgi:hypothetical protein